MADEQMMGAEADDVQFMRTVNDILILVIKFHLYVIVLFFRKIIYA